MKKNITFFTLLIICSSSVFAQKKSEKSFFVRTNLLVVDSQNNFANDLGKEDFSITENGVAQPITYFAKKQLPLNVVIVADNSGSLRTQIGVIDRISKLIVANLMPGDEAKIIRFIGRERISVEQDWTSDKALLNKASDDFFTAGGQSAVIDALYLTSEDLKKRYDAKKDGRYAIVLISDCEDRDSYYTEKNLYKLIGDRDMPILTVSLTKEISKTIPKEMSTTSKALSDVEALGNSVAMRTGGTSFMLGAGAKEEDYQAVLKSLIFELRSQYVIGYQSKEVTKQTAARTISIVAKDGPKGEKRSVVSKTSFTLPIN